MKQGLMRGLAAFTASLCAVSLVAASYAPTRAAFINSRLGTVSYKLEETGEQEGDSYYFESEFSSLEDLLGAKAELAEQISSEGTTLLKNTNAALPLDSAAEKVTLWGHNSVFNAKGGMIGSTASAAEGQDDFGLIDAMFARGFQLNEQMIGFLTSDEAFAYTRQTFFPGAGLVPSFEATWEAPAVYLVGELPASMYTDDVLASADDTAAVCVITRDSSEAADYEVMMFNGTEGDSFERPLALSQYEKDMIELAKQHSTKVIVLINANNPMELEELKNDPDIDAIVWAGEPGVYGFLGVADVLSGAANPSGHLPDTYAVNSASAPAMQNFGLYMYTNNSNNGSAQGDIPQLTVDNKADWYVVEQEGIYQGYKYYETRYEDEILGQGNASAAEGSSNGSAWSYANEVSYPFGYGSSYTTFEQKLDSVNVNIGGLGEAQVTVTNTGDVAGKSVVELFVQSPYTEGGLEKSAVQLAGFAKTSVLEPGASETVSVEIDPALFASYDETVTKADGTVGAWVLEAGDYYFAIGNGVHNALNNILAAKTGSDAGLISVNDDEVISADNAKVWNLGETDVETYSVNVENALQAADINKLIPDTAEYTTRSDWSKGWKTVESITPTAEMMVGLTNSTYALSENGEGVTWGADNGLLLVNMIETDENGNFAGVADFNDERWQQLVEQVTLDEAIQFVEWCADDVENIDSVLLPRTYMNDGPLGFAFDQVAGYGTRWTKADAAAPTYVEKGNAYAGYSMAVMPTEPVVSATWNIDLVRREAELYGEDALWAKESVCIAPGINLHRTPYCARNHEYYSEDPVLTSLFAYNFCDAAGSKGLVTQTKHFAFNHQELNRSGISTFMTEQAGRENELRCFQKVMSTNATGTVMTAFNRCGTTFVGAYKGTLEQIARNEWGFLGGYVTDMVNGVYYMNWLDTVYAGGGTMLGSAPNWQGTSVGTMEEKKAEIAKDTEFQKQMQYTLKTWLYSLAQSNTLNGISTTSRIVKVLPWWQGAIYAAAAVTALLTALFLFLGIKAGKKRR